MIRKLQGLALASAALLMLSGCTGWQSALDVHGAAAINLKQLILLIVVDLLDRVDTRHDRVDFRAMAQAGQA